MLDIPTSQPVMVTGATGYVAGVLVKQLLEAGLTVHAPVRNPDAQDKLKYLDDIAANSPGSIHYFKADLLNRGSYAEAMQGCEVVFHTASPFVINVADPQKDLVDPARLGTQNVLEQANVTPSVKRVVLTSSCAAIYGDNQDLADAPNGTLNEQIWNTSSNLTHNPYSYSKTLAEQTAWSIAEQQTQWRLVVVNPSLVVGPGINPFASSESFNLIRQMGNGTFKAGAPRWGMGVVDVRDLATAHINAAFLPNAEGRHIICGHNTDLLSMAQSLSAKYGDDYPLPRKAVPKWLLWLVGPWVDKSMTRRMVARNVDLPWRADNRKSTAALGMTYLPLQQSMQDFFQQMIDSGQLPKPKP